MESKILLGNRGEDVLSICPGQKLPSECLIQSYDVRSAPLWPSRPPADNAQAAENPA